MEWGALFGDKPTCVLVAALNTKDTGHVVLCSRCDRDENQCLPRGKFSDPSRGDFDCEKINVILICNNNSSDIS